MRICDKLNAVVGNLGVGVFYAAIKEGSNGESRSTFP